MEQEIKSESVGQENLDATTIVENKIQKRTFIKRDFANNRNNHENSNTEQTSPEQMGR